MLQNFGFSGLLLCYGPLFLIFAGFVTFAFITDRISTGKYLRRLDPRPEEERVDEGPLPVAKATRAYTPAGDKVILQPTAAAAEAAGPDDLKKIEGVGPKIASVLAAAGLTTFAKVAEMSAEALRKVLDDAGMSAIHKTESWPQQATLAAAGKWDELQTLQDQLVAGR